MPSNRFVNRSGVLVLLLVLTMIGGLAQASEEGPVWFWFSTCRGPVMTLEVQFDTTTLYKSSFPLCHADRGSFYGQGQGSHVAFSFRPQRAIVWEGYRDEENTTSANEPIEGNIWQAGADPDALLIGISFHTHSIIYMNTIHIAHPDQRDETEIVRGLKIITYPGKQTKGKTITQSATLDSKVSEIRSEYRAIRSALPTFRKDTVSIFSYSTEGGEVTAYRDPEGNLRLMRVEHYGEMGKAMEEYYLSSGRLIFMYRELHQYNVPFYLTGKRAKEIGSDSFDPTKTTIAEDRYYFHDSKMIRWIDKSQKEVTPDSVDFRKAEKEVLSSFNTFVSKIK